MHKKLLPYLFLYCFSSISSANEAATFMAQIKTHYQSTKNINAFSLNHHYLNNHSRGLDYWDYQAPNRGMSQRVMEIDLIKKHFYDNDIHFQSGGRLTDRVRFQSSDEAYAYEKNGISLGKGVHKLSMDTFDWATRYIVMNVDFLAVRPLLDENDIEAKISIQSNDKNELITLIHNPTDDDTQLVKYQFSSSPLRLISVDSRPLGGVFTYDNYRTSRGITYAATVHQFYSGTTEPNYVIYNDQFAVIDQVDPEKLKVPEGFGPELKRGDGILVATPIADNLYLVTDLSGNRNSLLKISGDGIMVLGTGGSLRRARKTVGLIKEQFPDKKIASVYVTHPHRHQIAGLEAFVEQGAVVLADEYSIEAIKAFPDVAEYIANLKSRTLQNGQRINGVEFFVLENLHAKKQSFAYFKDSGIIYQSHFLHVPRDNTIAKVIPSYTRTFIEFVRRQQLKVNRIVGEERNNSISVDVMNKLYDSIM